MRPFFVNILKIQYIQSEEAIIAGIMPIKNKWNEVYSVLPF